MKPREKWRGEPGSIRPGSTRCNDCGYGRMAGEEKTAEVPAQSVPDVPRETATPTPMVCRYCTKPTGTAYDFHPECIALADRGKRDSGEMSCERPAKVDYGTCRICGEPLEKRSNFGEKAHWKCLNGGDVPKKRTRVVREDLGRGTMTAVEINRLLAEETRRLLGPPKLRTTRG